MPTCSPTIYASLHTCPNEDAAIAAASLFAAITLASLIITLKTRCWFVLFVPLTGALEAVGYGLRVSFVREPTFISLVIMQCCIIVSPVLLAIVDYVCLGRVIALADSQRVPIALRRFAPWIGRAFTLSDVLCLALQGFGGGMLVSEDAATQELGTRVLLVGILLQVVFFTLFLAITVSVVMYTNHMHCGAGVADAACGPMQHCPCLSFQGCWHAWSTCAKHGCGNACHVLNCTAAAVCRVYHNVHTVGLPDLMLPTPAGLRSAQQHSGSWLPASPQARLLLPAVYHRPHVCT